MNSPHTCPKCDGTRTVAGGRCPTCEGTGVVWEHATDEAAQLEREEALDLKGI